MPLRFQARWSRLWPWCRNTGSRRPSSASVTFPALPQATAGAQAVMIMWGVIHWGVVAAFVYRFGWLGNIVGASCTTWVAQTPLTTDVSAWYFGPGLLGAAVVLGLGVYGF